MTDILGVGELLVDFTPNGFNDQGMALYARNAGGSVPNMLAMYAKLGGRAAFVGKVGSDTFGDFLIAQLEQSHVDTSRVLRHPHVLTTLAIVSLLDNGDRAFNFYRKPGADILLMEEDIPLQSIASAPCFHFAGVSLTDEPSRSATFSAARYARSSGCFISFDCNHRASLWDLGREAGEVLSLALPLADIVKVSDEELHLLTRETDISAGAKAILGKGPAAVLVSQGELGSQVFTRELTVSRPAFQVEVMDTTGSGDAFLGAILYELRRLGKALTSLTAEEWGHLLAFGNAAGGLTATRRGGIPALPDREAIGKLLTSHASS